MLGYVVAQMGNEKASWAKKEHVGTFKGSGAVVGLTPLVVAIIELGAIVNLHKQKKQS